MKTLNEQIENVLKSYTSITAKRMHLEELQLTRSDIDVLLAAETAAQRAAARARRAAEAIVNSLTFGVEIECYNAPRTALLQRALENGVVMYDESYNHTDSTTHYKLVPDGSILGSDPVECVTPVLQGVGGFKSLKNCCKALREVGAKVNKSTGLHVHVGGIQSDEQYVNVFKNYQKLESVIDSFMAKSRRANNAFYAGSPLRFSYDFCYTPSGISGRMGCSRYYKVNPQSWSRHRTIEFRQHQGTTDFEKIKMWARFCIKLVAWSANNVLSMPVQTIDEIPFLDAAEKRFFNARANELAGEAA